MATHTREIYVDAGIVMIGDPCYTWPSDADSRKELGNGDWMAFCDAINTEEFPTIAEPFGPGMGTVVSSGLGDGCYKLTIETIGAGAWGERISSITLDLNLEDHPGRALLDDNFEDEEEEEV